MKPVIIITIAFVLLIPISVNAEVNPYEIIEVSLNKEFVENGGLFSSIFPGTDQYFEDIL